MRISGYILAGFLLLVPSVVAAQSLPAFPMAFWGSVTINGSAVPVGTVVRAYYGSTLAGTATVQEAGVYGYTEATKQKMVLGEGSGAITFKVQASGFNSGNETAGDSILTYSGFTSGLTVQKNLAFLITVPAPVSLGGGGGGGGGGLILGATISKGDATGDSKVDVLDFNTLLVQWGKTGTGLTADFDGNGSVDIFDFNLLLINWTK